MKKYITFVIILSSFLTTSGCVEDVNTQSSSQPKAQIKEFKIEESKQISIDPNVQLSKNLFQKNYYLIFDGSGSMSGHKLVMAKEAVKTFVNSISKDSKVGLAAFIESKTQELVSLDQDSNLINHLVDKIPASGGTPLKNAITFGFDKLKTQFSKQLGYGEYNLVIITDGEADLGQNPRSIVDTIISESPFIIHTIGINIGSNHSLNQHGKVVYKSANDLESLKQGLKDVLAEAPDFSVDTF